MKKQYMIVAQDEFIKVAIPKHQGFYKSRKSAQKDAIKNSMINYYIIEVPKKLGTKRKCNLCGK